MKKLIIILLLMVATAFGYTSRVPIVASFSDGGVPAIPTVDTVVVYDGPDSLRMIEYLYGYSSAFVDARYSIIDTQTFSHDERTLGILHHVVYSSGTEDYIWTTYTAPYGGTGDYICQLQVTDTASGSHTLLADADVSVYYPSTDNLMNKVTSNSGGKAYINVAISGTYSVVVYKPGHTFDAFTLTIPDTVTFDTGTVFQFIDTIPGTDNTTSTSCFATINVGEDFGLTSVANVKVTAKLSPTWNSCTEKFVAYNEEVLGFTDSNGRLTVELPRSTCIDDKKIKIKIGNLREYQWTIPDSSTTVLTYSNKD